MQIDIKYQNNKSEGSTLCCFLVVDFIESHNNLVKQFPTLELHEIAKSSRNFLSPTKKNRPK